MAKTLTTRIVFSGIDNVSRTLSGIERRVSGVSRNLTNSARRIRSAGATAGTLGIPIAFGVGKALRSFAEFNSALIENKALLDGNSEATERLRKQAVKLASTTKFSGTEVLQTQAEVIRSGRSEEDARALTPAILNQSIVTKVEPSIIADKLTNIIGSTLGDITGEELGKAAKRINDRLAFVANESNQSPLEAINFAERFAPIRNVADISGDQAASFSRVLANSGFKGRQGANALRTIVLRLNAPTKQARQALADLGVEFDKLVTGAKTITPDAALQAIRESGLSGQGGQASTIAGILNNTDLGAEDRIDAAIKKLSPQDGEAEAKLREALNRVILQAAGNLDEAALLKELKDRGINTAQVSAIFGKNRAAQGAALVSGANKIIAGTLEIEEGSLGAINRFIKVLREKFELPFKELKSATENLSNTIIGANQKRIIAFVDRIKAAVNSLQKTFEKNPALARLALSIAAITAVAGPLLVALGLMASGLAVLARGAAILLSPLKIIGKVLAFIKPAFTGSAKAAGFARGALARLGAVGLVAAGAITVLSNAWQGIKTAFSKVKLSEIVSGLGDALKAFAAGNYGAAFDALAQSTRSLRAAFVESFTAIANSVINLITNIIPGLGTFLRGFESGFNFDGIKRQFSGLIDAFINLGDVASKFGQVFTAVDPETAQAFSNILNMLGEAFGRFIGLGIETAIDVITTAINGLAGALQLVLDVGRNLVNFNIGGALNSITTAASEGILGVAKFGSRLFGRVGEQATIIPEEQGKFGVFGEQRPDDFLPKGTLPFPQPQIPTPANSNLRQVDAFNIPPAARGESDVVSLQEIREQTQAAKEGKQAVDGNGQKIDGTNNRLDRVISGLDRVATATERVPSAINGAVKASTGGSRGGVPRPERLSSNDLQTP